MYLKDVSERFDTYKLSIEFAFFSHLKFKSIFKDDLVV